MSNQGRNGRRGLSFGLLVGLALAAGCSGGQDPGAAAKGGKAAAERVIPVVATPAAVRDVAIALEGLGTVTAYKTVNIHTQVEGRLDKVSFREGQAVKKGELLAQIDPRPFAIAVHQAEAALARDTAQLAGAKRNLERFEGVGAQHLIPQQQVDDQRALVDQLTGDGRLGQGPGREREAAAQLRAHHLAHRRRHRRASGRPGQPGSRRRRYRHRRGDPDRSHRGAVHAAAGRSPQHLARADPKGRRAGAGRRGVQPRRRAAAGDRRAGPDRQHRSTRGRRPSA